MLAENSFSVLAISRTGPEMGAGWRSPTTEPVSKAGYSREKQSFSSLLEKIVKARVVSTCRGWHTRRYVPVVECISIYRVNSKSATAASV
jgi:hypothetical protein